MAQTQTRNIRIKIDTQGDRALKDIADKMGGLTKSTKSLASNMSLLTNAFTGWLGFLGVRELTQMADQMQNLSSRLKITAQEGENTAETMQKIADLADRTNQSIGQVGEVYNRLAISLAKVNPRADELVSLSEVLINTFRVAGANAAETSSTIIQLSQAFQSGELRGQELRSVMEQNGVLAKLLTKEFGAQESVYKRAEKGQIRVTDVLKLLAKEQERVAMQAKNLAPTFEQTLTKAMNKLSLAVDTLNKQFKLSEGFAWLLAGAVENLANIFAVATPVIVAWAASYIPSLIRGFQALRVASIAFAASNPVLLALTAISVVIGLVVANFDKLTIVFKKFQIQATEFGIKLEETLNKIRPQGMADAANKRISASKEYVTQLRGELKKLEAAQKTKETGAATVDADKSLQSLIERYKGFDKVPQKLEKVKEILGQINKELDDGRITVEEYNKKLVDFELYKLNREFREGKFDVFTFNQRLTELNLQGLNRDLKNGVISMQQFRAASNQMQLEDLNAKFQAGKITLSEYNSELIKISDQFQPGAALQVGTSNYIESIGTLSEQVAKGITATFGHLEDNLFEFIKTGKFNFAQFTQSILDDLTKIIIRASIIRPLANAILGGAGGAASGLQAGDSASSFSGYAAKGMAFDNNVRKFAKGGIVDSPTAFSYGGGKRGLMGEAGTEAIMPLQRTANGDLGVAASVTPVTVNIINNSSSNVEQRESTGPGGEKMIDILISNRVREGILTGQFDKPMKQAYGLSRKGS